MRERTEPGLNPANNRQPSLQKKGYITSCFLICERVGWMTRSLCPFQFEHNTNLILRIPCSSLVQVRTFVRNKEDSVQRARERMDGGKEEPLLFTLPPAFKSFSLAVAGWNSVSGLKQHPHSTFPSLYKNIFKMTLGLF